jgi:hypothetical protein
MYRLIRPRGLSRRGGSRGLALLTKIDRSAPGWFRHWALGGVLDHATARGVQPPGRGGVWLAAGPFLLADVSASGSAPIGDHVSLR